MCRLKFAVPIVGDISNLRYRRQHYATAYLSLSITSHLLPPSYYHSPRTITTCLPSKKGCIDGNAPSFQVQLYSATPATLKLHKLYLQSRRWELKLIGAQTSLKHHIPHRKKQASISNRCLFLLFDFQHLLLRLNRQLFTPRAVLLCTSVCLIRSYPELIACVSL